MRWGQSRFLLEPKGKLMGDDGSIVPRSVAAGKVAGFFECCPPPRQRGMSLPRDVRETLGESGREIFE
jgi:hypothetical protein